MYLHGTAIDVAVLLHVNLITIILLAFTEHRFSFPRNERRPLLIFLSLVYVLWRILINGHDLLSTLFRLSSSHVQKFTVYLSS